MPIDARATGALLESRNVEITTRQLLAYAACIGQTTALAFDDAREGGIIAVPQFCVSLEWPVVSSGRALGPLGALQSETRRAVHVSQDSIFHRPICPGDRLITEGELSEIRPTGAGAFIMTKLTTRDVETGEPVVSSWSGAIYRGVAVENETAPTDGPPPLPVFEQPGSGEQSIDVPIAPEMAHLYTECAQIWNPIHTERQAALAAGLPGIIVHGTMTWAIAAKLITQAWAGDDHSRIKRIHGRFGAMLYPGETMTVRHWQSSHTPKQIHFDVRNIQGDVALSGGLIELA